MKSTSDLSRVMSDAKAEFVEALITRKHPLFEAGQEWDFYLECEICGILKCTRRTLASWGVPRYPAGNKITYYRLSEVRNFLLSRRET